MSKNAVIVLSLILFVLAGWYYWSSLPPAGVEARGTASDIKEWVSLGVTIVSFLTGVITLWLKLQEARAKAS